MTFGNMRIGKFLINKKFTNCSQFRVKFREKVHLIMYLFFFMDKNRLFYVLKYLKNRENKSKFKNKRDK